MNCVGGKANRDKRQQLEDLMNQLIPVKSSRIKRPYLETTHRELVEGRGSREYLGNLMHRVVQGGAAARAGLRQPTVLLLEVLDSRQLLLGLAPRPLPIPDPTPHKLLNPGHLHLTILQALSSIRQVLCIGALATAQVVDKRRADAVVAIKVWGGLTTR